MVLLLNNLGALPVIELSIITKEVMQELKSRGVVVVRAYVGTFMTALDMNGFSLSLLNIDNNNNNNNNYLSLLDQFTNAPAWQKSDVLTTTTTTISDSIIPYNNNNNNNKIFNKTVFDFIKVDKFIINVVVKVCEKIIFLESLLTDYDKICGDGIVVVVVVVVVIMINTIVIINFIILMIIIIVIIIVIVVIICIMIFLII